MLDPDHCDQVLDPGPPADDPKVTIVMMMIGDSADADDNAW